MERCTCTNYDSLPLTLRVDEIMPILGIGRNNAYNLVRSGELRCLKIGRQYRIPRDALILYLKEGKAQPRFDPYSMLLKR